MKKMVLLQLLLFLAAPQFAQTYLPITNNMVVASNSNIKFIPGNYILSDAPADGVIQLNGVQNVILDGDSCMVDGVGKTGYMIKISNSSNITIKNFDSVFRYKYAVYITNSADITINGNNFCYNKVDSAGWIDVWADYTQALGGGVMMYQTRAARIFDNVMTMQNDGVALYHCDSIKIHDNDFSWNTSYGIRMFWTDTCHIYQNNCSHVNRPLTDPSDCAAILLIISNANKVEYNDLSWSGDGVFLGQYQHSTTQNNNYFAYNECSYSPHNAIEATFADGNVYKHNKCNYSHYGVWLGYSFNSVVDSNEVIGNYQSGIAVDRGFSNSITGNRIENNPIGIELWEGTPVGGYASFRSQDYQIMDNIFEGNTKAVSSINTKHALIRENLFNYNQQASIFIEGISATDTITANTFTMPTGFHIYNNSTNNKYAVGNLFLPSDTAMIAAKIYDKKDNSLKGTVAWDPPLPGPETTLQSIPPCDMAEPGSMWFAYPEVGYPPKIKIPDSVLFDTVVRQVGASSVKMSTTRGWDLALNYRPGNDSLSRWTLSENDTLFFWVRTIKQPQYGFQFFSVRLGDDHGNYYKYNASPSLLNAANLVWKRYAMPLAGNSQFSRTATGAMSLDQVNYVEFHADTWDYGFTLWVDGVQFESCSPITGLPEAENGETELTVFPNPVNTSATIRFDLPQPGFVTVECFNSNGKLIETLRHGFSREGEQQFQWQPPAPGFYFISLTTPRAKMFRKVICQP
jgi:parallel beta-helix repeat protein